VTLRAVGIGRTIRASLDVASTDGVAEGTPAPAVGSRRVRVGRDETGALDVRTYDGSALRPGHVIEGPALVDGVDTTVWIPPDVRARFDARSTITMEVAP
jgi:N-methylhydantoinase A